MSMNICNFAVNLMKPKELCRLNNSHKRQTSKKLKIRSNKHGLMCIYLLNNMQRKILFPCIAQTKITRTIKSK